MHLSYAQNLEDYHLNRIFGDVAEGTYVDVGGGHPVADNVSFYFYLKGWRGLVVEPQAGLAAAYAGVRPRDRVVSDLAGRSDGTIDFHIVEGLHGLSSAVKENADSAQQYGAKYRTEKRPVRRLSRLIDEAGLKAIDFLKIDVEGAEADVLGGLDLARHRPRVILVEAVNPNVKDGDWAKWEPLLTGANYSFVFFDNLNRFYVANEHAALKAKFPKEPTPWHDIGHLWDCGRVLDKPEHPDRALGEVLSKGLMALLPTLPPKLIAELIEAGLSADKKAMSPEVAASLIGKAEWPGASLTALTDVAEIVATDRFKGAVGRMACMYDGGHLLT
jgi:FkbM family methyltransferase